MRKSRILQDYLTDLGEDTDNEISFALTVQSILSVLTTAQKYALKPRNVVLLVKNCSSSEIKCKVYPSSTKSFIKVL